MKVETISDNQFLITFTEDEVTEDLDVIRVERKLKNNESVVEGALEVGLGR